MDCFRRDRWRIGGRLRAIDTLVLPGGRVLALVLGLLAIAAPARAQCEPGFGGEPALAFTADGDVLAAIHTTGEVVRIGRASARVLRRDPEIACRASAFEPDGGAILVAVGTDRGTEVRRIDLDTGATRTIGQVPSYSPTRLELAPDGAHVLVVSPFGDSRATVLATATGDRVVTLAARNATFIDSATVAFETDRLVIVEDLARGRLAALRDRRPESYQLVRSIPADGVLRVVRHEGAYPTFTATAGHVEVARGRATFSADHPLPPRTSIAMFAAGTWVSDAPHSNRLTLYRPDGSEPAQEADVHRFYRAAAVSTDGLRVAMTSEAIHPIADPSPLVEVLDVERGARATFGAAPVSHAVPPRPCAFMGPVLAFAGADLWLVRPDRAERMDESGTVTTLAMPPDVVSAAFTADGSRLFYLVAQPGACDRGELFVWSVGRGAPSSATRVAEGLSAHRMEPSPAGTRVIVGDAILDVASGTRTPLSFDGYGWTWLGEDRVVGHRYPTSALVDAATGEIVRSVSTRGLVAPTRPHADADGLWFLRYSSRERGNEIVYAAIGATGVAWTPQRFARSNALAEVRPEQGAMVLRDGDWVVTTIDGSPRLSVEASGTLQIAASAWSSDGRYVGVATSPDQAFARVEVATGRVLASQTTSYPLVQASIFR